VFSIFPPALDEIHRWLRDQARLGIEKLAEENKEETKGEAEKVEEKARKRTRKESKE
jgi:hypothetical protein